MLVSQDVPERPVFDLVVYHGGRCMDGLMSAALAKSFNPDAEYVPWNYSDLLPDVRGKTVLFVDVCPAREVLGDLLQQAIRLVLVDHHPLAGQVRDLFVDRLENYMFSIEHSAVMLLFYYYYGHYEAPDLFRYVEDRDLWVWKLPNSQIVSTGLACCSGFQLAKCTEWVHGIRSNPETAHEIILECTRVGLAIQQYKTEQIEDAVSTVHRVDIPGSGDGKEQFGIVNTRENISEVGSAIAGLPPTEDGRRIVFGVVWYYLPHIRMYQVSFRSSGSQADVSSVARAMGGGGHRNSSGVRIANTEDCDPEHLVSRIIAAYCQTHGLSNAFEL